MPGHLAWTFVFGALVGACSGGSSDDDVANDAGDATAPIDTGSNEVCSFTTTVTTQIVDVMPGPSGAVDLTGAATVLDDPNALALRTESGSVVRAVYNVPGGDTLTFTPGDRVWIEFAARGPFWVNHQIEVYTLAAGGGPGELRLAAWWGEHRLQPVLGWTLEMEDGGCNASDSCGAAVGSNLRVITPGGTSAEIAPGAFSDLAGYRVANGQSWRYLSTIICTDTPPTWSGVSVVRL